MGGFIIFLCGSNKYTRIAWKSKKLEQVVKITISAETLASEALESCYMILSLLCEKVNKEMHHDLFSIDCYTDNTSLANTISSTKAIPEERFKVLMCVLSDN